MLLAQLDQLSLVRKLAEDAGVLGFGLVDSAELAVTLAQAKNGVGDGGPLAVETDNGRLIRGDGGTGSGAGGAGAAGAVTLVGTGGGDG